MVADFSKKQKRDFDAKEIAFQIAGILCILIIGVLIFSDIKMYQRKKELISEIANYQKQIAEIKKNSQTLKDEIANSNNPDYIEKIAYEQLGEQKPGENEVIFVSPPKKTAAISQPANSWTGWLSQAWSWIKSKF